MPANKDKPASAPPKPKPTSELQPPAAPAPPAKEASLSGITSGIIYDPLDQAQIDRIKALAIQLSFGEGHRNPQKWLMGRRAFHSNIPQARSLIIAHEFFAREAADVK